MSFYPNPPFRQQCRSAPPYSTLYPSPPLSSHPVCTQFSPSPPLPTLRGTRPGWQGVFMEGPQEVPPLTSLPASSLPSGDTFGGLGRCCPGQQRMGPRLPSSQTQETSNLLATTAGSVPPLCTFLAALTQRCALLTASISRGPQGQAYVPSRLKYQRQCVWPCICFLGLPQ